VVDDDDLLTALVRATLERAGLRVLTAGTGLAALSILEHESPALIISDVNMPDLDGFELLHRLRANPTTAWIPVLMLTTRRATADVVAGLALGADDYLPKPFTPDELVARVTSKLERPPVPIEHFPVDRDTGLLTRARLLEETSRESIRSGQSGREGVFAVIGLSEMKGIQLRLGQSVAKATVHEVVRSLSTTLAPLDRCGRIDEERVGILMPETNPSAARARLRMALASIAGQTIRLGEERIRITPSAGFVSLDDANESAEAPESQATSALDFAVAHLDLQPTQWIASMEPEVAALREGSRKTGTPRGFVRRLRTPLQFLVTVLIGLVAPFFLYMGLDRAGYDITPYVYVVVVVSLVLTGALIWAEGVLSLRGNDPPSEPAEPFPPASAIIAAYLPNEAATLIETLEAFRRIDYPAPLQVILAYNTPSPMPVEAALQEMARVDPRLTVVKVEVSTSKAQNVNAALGLATGRFVGVFDADHLPDSGSFRRAWRWLSHGYDVVQGHCLVRNGAASFVGRMVAVEFEGIYAVSHPGRARLHRFGIFGGSNGYWRTDLLHEIRMQGSMLTEDIDSTLRVIEAGGRIASDPDLISRELGTTTLKQVWNQRMRWAQGWFQVSHRHFLRALTSSHLGVRQKLGMVHLLAWREIYPWLSPQVIPIVAYWIYRGDALDWRVPIFILTSAFTLSVGPFQTFFAWRRSAPEIRRHPSWFLAYLVFSSIFYTEFKNVIARVSHIKELTGERDWRVTPRSSEGTDAAAPPQPQPRPRPPATVR